MDNTNLSSTSSSLSTAPPVKAKWFRTAILSKTIDSSVNAEATSPDDEQSAMENPENPVPDKTQAKIIAQKKSIISTITSTQWFEFSEEETNDLEESFIRLQTNPSLAEKIAVGEDDMFEVDVSKRILYPLYWEGPPATVIRATWFTCDSSGKIGPLDELLSSQVEDGYQKFTPWKTFIEDFSNTSPTQSMKVEELVDSVTMESEDETRKPPFVVETVINPSPSGNFGETAQEQKATKFKWSLFGPYSSNHVIYTGHSSAWLMSENVTAKLTQAIYSRISSGENLGGVRIIRGHENAIRYANGKKKTQEAEVTPVATLAEKKKDVDIYELRKHRKNRKKHLILATHGIGQKLGEKSSTVDFIQDINNLRKNLKQSHQKQKGEEECPLMVLPIEWRRKLLFDSQHQFNDELSQFYDQSLPSVDEITLETVPGLRAIISDVLLDVLLFMEPHHRNDMICAIIEEMNRVYRIFIRNHPKFIEEGGKVHLFAHSLGSLICLDAVSHYGFNRAENNLSFDRSGRQEFSPVDLSDMTEDHRNHRSRARRSASNPIQSSLGNTTSSFNPDIPYLEFPISRFFALGSPLGLFMRIKEKRLGMPLHAMLRFYAEFVKSKSADGQDSNNDIQLSRKQLAMAKDWIQSIEKMDNIMHPDVDQLFHVFHPSDVIAYRLEPLICRTLANKKPETIQIKTTGTSRALSLPIPMTFRWAEQWMGYAIGSWTGIQITGTATTPTTSNSTRRQSDSGTKSGKSPVLQNPKSISGPTSPIRNNRRDDVPPKPKFKPEDILAVYNSHHRVDFTLQERILESQYFTALQVHFGYWTNEDVGLFVMQEILR